MRTRKKSTKMEWGGVTTVLATINAALYTTLAGVAAALLLFHVGDRVVLRFTMWRLGGRSPRAAAETFDLRDIHVLRVCNDVGESWEDCKAHIVQFLPGSGDAVTVVRSSDSNGRILSAHTRSDSVVFTTGYGYRAHRGRVPMVVVMLPGGPIDLGNMRAGMTGHSIGTVDALDCERLRALIARHRDRETRVPH